MLEVEGLHAFYGNAHILHDVALGVGRGEVAALLGRNGAGKSTTMKSIIGLLKPARGRVRFVDQDIAGLPPHRVCRLGLGYVPEERRIFADLSVDENLEVGRRPSRPGAAAWNANKLFALFPNLAERRRQSGRSLSGGEQQMLAIARTLMGNPALVLLDEPSEGLAPLIVEQMADAIRAMKAEGLSVLISEQNLHFAKAISDRAHVIEQGRVRFSGSIAELEAHPEVRDAYLAV